MIKRFEVVFRPEARSDMDVFYFSILDLSKSFVTADRYIDRLGARCEKIGDAPFGGRVFGSSELNLRLVPFERSAVIIYRVEQGRIIIERVFSGRSDYLKHFDDT